jgi:hypothetical protein
MPPGLLSLAGSELITVGDVCGKGSDSHIQGFEHSAAAIPMADKAAYGAGRNIIKHRAIAIILVTGEHE